MTDSSETPLRRALLVEDSKVNQKLLSSMLHSAGFEVVIADNGQEGVDKFKAESFDLVIMDIQMPVLDGLSATRLIREHEVETDNRTPIVAVTAGMDRGSCMKADMDDYIEKPVRIPIFHEVVRRVCGGVLLMMNTISF